MLYFSRSRKFIARSRLTVSLWLHIFSAVTMLILTASCDHVHSKPRNISQPASYWDAFQCAAEVEGMTLSEWMAKCCLKALPKEIVKGLADRPASHRPVFYTNRESNVTIWRVQSCCDDLAAFEDPKQIDKHFGFPMENVFSISLRPGDGRSNVHDTTYRSAYFGNAVAYREIKIRYPNAWIWDERYRFEGRPANTEMLRAQLLFEKKMDSEAIAQICVRAKEAELNPGGKTAGRPDLAVYIPGDPAPWRFIEIKRLDRGDAVRPNQRKWLQLLGSYFGDGSAIVMELSMTGQR